MRLFSWFTSKKPKPTKPIVKKDNFFDDSSRIPGDVDIYTINYRSSKESAFYITKNINSNDQKISHEIDEAGIINDKIISELMSKYKEGFKINKNIEEKKSRIVRPIKSINIKSLKETLNKIRGYNNSKKYEIRHGFASTLFTKAEEIGSINTVRFLLKVIDEQLVFYFYL